MIRSFLSSVIVFSFLIVKSQSLELVADINPGSADGATNYYFVKEFQGNFFFPANHVGVGRELSVLMNDTVLLVKDILPGGASSNPSGFFIFDNQLFFFAYASGGLQIWKTDGTEQGTTSVLTFPGSTFSYSPFFVGSRANKFYFTRNGNLFVSEGTQASTISTDGSLDINFEENFPFVTRNVDKFKDGIAFIIDHGVDFRLYSAVDTNITLLGTFPFLSQDSYSVLGPFEVEAGLVVVVRNGDGSVGDLYLYDKNTESLAKYNTLTIVANTINRISDNKILITTDENGSYSTDGTSSGTVKIINTSANPSSGSELPLVRIGDAIMFHGDEPANSDAVYATNGTIAGTRLVRSIPGNGISNFVAHGEYAFWLNDNSFNGRPELWTANINSGGATRLYEHPTAFNNVTYEISPIGATADKVYFIAKINDNIGREIYSFTHHITTATTTISGNNPYEIQLDHGAGTFKIIAVRNEPIEIGVFDLLGRQVNAISINTNEWQSLPDITGIYLFFIHKGDARTSMLVPNFRQQ